MQPISSINIVTTLRCHIGPSSVKTASHQAWDEAMEWVICSSKDTLAFTPQAIS